MARRASVTNNSDLSGQDHRRAENKWKTPMENSENGSAELKKIIDAITGKKVVAGGTAHALEYAKNAWEKCGGDELIPEMDENAESRFWWRLLAYRYANLLMRVAGSIDDFRFAEKLFDKATGMKDPKGKQSYRELTLLSKIYRIAVIRRILSSDAIDSEERAKYSTLQNNVWSSLFNSRLSLDTEIHTNSPSLQTCFHHLLEVTSYGNGLAYEDGLEGQNVIIGIPDSKFDGYQVVDNRQAFSTTLYRYCTLPKPVALSGDSDQPV